MTIDAQMARRTIVEAEFRVLQAMCCQGGQGPVWRKAIEMLSDYRFRDPLHKLVFDVLRAIPEPAPASLQEIVVQRLTNRGFPDVDIEPFFHPHAMADDLALAILEHLQFTSRLDSKPGLAGQL
jgi:hypothetical protein